MSELVLENNCIIPNNWKLTNVEEILKKLESGSRPKGGVKSIKNGIPSIGGEHLTNNGDFQFEKIKFVPKEFYNSMTLGHIKKNDILIVKDGATTGKTSFISTNFPYEKSAVNEHVFIIRTFENFISSQFLFYFFCSPYGQQIIKSRITGTAQGGINTSFVKKFPILIPPINEQKRIVEKIEKLFSISNHLQELLKKNLLNVNSLKNSILQYAFTGKLIPQNPNDPPLNIIPVIQKKNTGRKASTGVIMGKLVLSVGKPNTVLPKGWKWVSLLQVAELASGHTPKRQNSEYWDGKISWVTGSDAGKYDGNYIFETKEKITQLGVENSAAVVLPKDTVCFAREASIGFCVMLGKPMATNQRFVNFICGDSLIPKYLMYLFLFERNYMFRFKEGSIFGTIYFPAVKAFHISLPPINEQKRIVEKIDYMLSLTKNIECEIIFRLDTLDSFKKSVLKYAFEGKLVPQDPNDEPAEIPLQKIKQEKEQLKQKEKSKKRKKNGR